MQNNVFFETKYSTIIEPLFGQTRSLMPVSYTHLTLPTTPYV